MFLQLQSLRKRPYIPRKQRGDNRKQISLLHAHKMNQYNIWNQPNEAADQSLSPDLLISKLSGLSKSPQYTQFVNSLDGYQDYNESMNYTFHLPPELQGGISNINSRRPSFTAEQTYTHPMAQYNVPMYQQTLNFQSRRPSVQINTAFSLDPLQQQMQQAQQPVVQQKSLELENGLLLSNGVIISSQQLQQTFHKTKNYFCADSAMDLYNELRSQCQGDSSLQKVIVNLKKLNNMFSLIKPLVLVLTKAGKYEILSTPMNSNILLQKNDVIIVDGDRGKDMVYVLDPSVTLDVAILINYLKKRQHAKSISYGGTHQVNNGMISNTVSDLVKGQGILDEETQFQIPTKQVLRFATFQEVGNLQFKLVEEIKSFKTSLLKISNQPLLSDSLTILSSEYQFDQKKLTFFYCSSQRLDFRNLIKELFKIYKTRIWLCAVPKPPGTMIMETNNELDFEQCKVNDFHVRNFGGTLVELMNEMK